MLLSQALNAFGVVLDIAGFTILFALALPAVMRRNFVTSDRVGLDGVEPDFSAFEQFGSRLEARRREEKRGKRQTLWYCTGGLMVLVGFTLQLIALFVS